MSKENVHDEQIIPLVHQIIGICKEHNIALLLSAHLQDEDDRTQHLLRAFGNSSSGISELS